jgi:predicted enzyme related to lactoylglutathione lyase
MEMIEVMGLDGFDYAHQCDAPNLGILAVRYPVADIERAKSQVLARGGAITRDIAIASLGGVGTVELFSLKTPDGAIMQFFSDPAAQ